MLVLSRQRDETIVATVPPSDQPTVIEMTIVDIRGDKVRVGTTAPRAVTVHRKEVQREVGREKRERDAKAAEEKAARSGGADDSFAGTKPL